MPLSPIQAEVLRLIAGNRSPESYLAGATVLHRSDDSPRFSQDIDLFHDLEESVARSAEKDSVTLRDAGCQFSWVLRTPQFHRAVVKSKNQSLLMEWAQDSAFRFFPLQEDALCGYRLHHADAATNKVLAFAGRSEIRDFVDVLDLHANYLSLGALVWAACGKDTGFTPDFLLDQASRHTAYTPNDLARLALREPLDLKIMKQRWLVALEEARTLVAALPPQEIGCFYVRAEQTPVSPDPASKEFGSLLRHHGCVRGAWPVVSPS